MKVVFDLDDKLIVTEAQELIGQEGELTLLTAAIPIILRT